MPMRLDCPSRRQHNFLTPPWMIGDEVGDIVDVSPVGHPYFILDFPRLGAIIICRC